MIDDDLEAMGESHNAERRTEEERMDKVLYAAEITAESNFSQQGTDRQGD